MLSSTSLEVSGTTSRSKGASRYRPEIDGLRAFAVIAVIINHFNKDVLPSGYLGVDIFFVISGFVITSSLLGRESKNFGDFLAGFYERRIKRLVPALVIFVLATSLLICLFNPEPGSALGLGWRSLFGISNIQLYRLSTDYFAESTDLNPFVHTWSLGVEEQFYLLFPFLIWFSGFGRQTVRGARNLFWIVGTLSIASAIGYIYLSQVNQPASYFLMPPRFWEMSAGCLVFLALHRRAWVGNLLQKIPTTLIAIAMIGVMFLPVSTAVPATFSIVILTGLLIGGLRAGTAIFKFLTIEKVVYIGLISYSLYLWHWGVLSISRWTIGIHWWSVPIQLGLMFGISIASYRWVETPLRKSTWFPSRILSVAGGIGLLAISSASILYASRSFARDIFVGNIKRGQAIYSERVKWNYSQCSNDRRSGEVPTDSDYSKCWINAPRGSNPPHATSSVRVFTYGNSYNEQLTPMYAELANQNSISIHSYFASGCTASQRLQYSKEGIPGHCSRVFTSYIKWFMKNSQPGDKLIIANSLSYFSQRMMGDKWLSLDGRRIGAKDAYKHYVDEISTLGKEIKADQRDLFLVSGIPYLSSNPDICSQWYSVLNTHCDKTVDLDLDNSLETKLINERLSSDLAPHIGFIDIYTPIKEAISSNGDYYSLYYNQSHLSRKGSTELTDVFNKAIGSRD